ncbi:MAG TPA: AAA family ATPase [Thermodesulfobacteriota bacterium]|nr:AAA family ATPase [Thermodesulfobacteriota bacterium]
MNEKDPLKDLQLLIHSRYCIIFLDTAEEERAETLLKHLADSLRLPFFSWTPTKGLRREIVKGSVYGSTDPSTALTHIEHAQFKAVYHFQDLGDFLEDKLIVTKLKDAAMQFAKNDGVIVITGHDVNIPDAIKPISALLKLPEPKIGEYKKLLDHILRDLNSKMAVKLEATEDDINRLLNNLKGLTLMEAEKILTKIIVEDGKLAPADVRKVIESKKVIVEREGLLEYYPVEESMADIADLSGLKSWLAKRRKIITEPEKAQEFGLSFPKGVLLLGVPGCGKSLCAKAVAMEWGLPLLKLDPANLYNKYMGESEKNFKRAIKTAEKLAPVILWIDEIEKAFSSSNNSEDGGVSMRIFGTFLSWLQDRRGDVFIVATANDVAKLPPEFLRKGRFDEIFFVDLPNAEARNLVFEIHLKKRGQEPNTFDIPLLVERTEGFSGSEIEQVIVSGLYTAFSNKTDLSDQTLLNEVSLTRPLSMTMAEKIGWLREWARERTVRAE